MGFSGTSTTKEDLAIRAVELRQHPYVYEGVFESMPVRLLFGILYYPCYGTAHRGIRDYGDAASRVHSRPPLKLCGVNLNSREFGVLVIEQIEQVIAIKTTLLNSILSTRVSSRSRLAEGGCEPSGLAGSRRTFSVDHG
jgi:hypothetical protein